MLHQFLDLMHRRLQWSRLTWLIVLKLMLIFAASISSDREQRTEWTPGTLLSAENNCKVSPRSYGTFNFFFFFYLFINHMLINIFIFLDPASCHSQAVTCLMICEELRAHARTGPLACTGPGLYTLICMEITKYVEPKDVISNPSY